jgi:hypothetical protein
VFLERLLTAKELKGHKNFTAPKQRNGTFIVNHYAGSVTYTVRNINYHMIYQYRYQYFVLDYHEFYCSSSSAAAAQGQQQQ